MRLLPASIAWLLATSASLLAQPAALSVNPASREEVRQFYRAIYHASEGVPMNWTGSYATGSAGDTSAAFKEATRLRINFFRALAGVPAGVTFNATYSAKAQQAALMMSANNALDHFPPASWTFYTAEGAEAAANSNLYLGDAGPAAISGYVADAGGNNAAVGHRRWLFYPQTLQMGTGDVPGDASRRPANATWIVDTGAGRFGAPRPATRTTAVAYPPAGFVPYQVVWPRWSFSHPGADFSAATVTMTRNGQAIPVTLEPLSTSSGEPTLVWVCDNQNTANEAPHARPAADTTYAVNVSNVRVGGTMQPAFSYNVTVFDPDVAGADAAPVTVTGSAVAALGAANSYTVSKPTFVGGFDWRTLQLAPFAKTFTAEGGLDGLNATTTGGYNVVQSAVVAAGSSAYRLAHLSPRSTQVLQLPDLYYVSGTDATITFRSRLGIATSIETARVEVSTDGGVSWIEAFAQAGTSATNTSQPAPAESAFVTRTIALGAHAGRTIHVRFAYAIEASGVAFVPDATNGVGWFIDNITLTSVQTAAAGAAARVAAGNALSFTPATAGAVALQARGVLFGAYPTEWGPALPVTALDGAANNNPGRLINMSIRTNAGTGDNTLIVGVVVGGANTRGTKAVLLRGVGPTLAAFGVAGALADSVLTVFQETTPVAQNDDWAGGFDFNSVGAFPFSGNPPRDAAIYSPTTASGGYSIQITGKNNATGVALAEIYDATPASAFTATTPRLANVSARTHVGTGDNILIAGFVVVGSPMRVLVRAVGPTLGGFGVTGTLANPRLEIFSSPTVRVAENDNWSGTAELKVAFASVGAFALAADNSPDAALVATLPPGNYTAQVTGVNNTTGVALVEVYELP